MAVLFALVLGAFVIAPASVMAAPQPPPSPSKASASVPSTTREVEVVPAPPAALLHGPSKSQRLNRPLLSPDAAALAHAKGLAAQRAAAAHPSTGQTPPAPKAPKTSIYGGNNMAGLGAGCCSPSDSTGDHGPNNFIEMVNTEVAVYPPACGPCGATGTAPLEVFAGFPGACALDPQIEWDPQGGRWLYSMAVLIPSVQNQCGGTFTDALVGFGWSRTSDPTDLQNGWCRFGLVTGSYIYDFDKLGHDNNFISFGANIYSNFGNLGAAFVSATIVVVRKPAVGTASCATPATADQYGTGTTPLRNADSTLAFTPVPADTKDSSAYGYVVAAHDVSSPPAATSNKLMVWHLSSSSGGSVLTADGDFAVASYGVPPPVPQSITGTAPCATAGNCVDSLDGRLTQVIAHTDPDVGREAVWTQHGVSDATSALSVERWYELVPSLGTVHQSGDISDPSLYVFNGAVSPTMAGNEAVIFYNEGGPSGNISWWAQSRNRLTPLNTFMSPVFLANSAGNDDDFTCGDQQTPKSGSSCRWGDYAAARPDPNSTNAVWGVGMLNGMQTRAPSWFTQIAAITPGCATALITGGFGPSYRNNWSFNASSSGCANPQYEFWLRYPNGTWSMKQPFSNSATWTWDSTGAPLGSYLVHVWATQVGDSTASWDAFAELAFTLLQPPPCSTAAIGPLSASQPAGSMVGFVAASNGCQAPVYEYWFQDLGGTWNLGRPFSADPSWSWNTAGFAPGTYNIHVWGNQQGDSTSSLESFASATATLTGCTSASISPPSTSQPAGSMVNLTASSAGCPNPVYEFWVGYPDGSYHMKQAFSPSASFSWNTTGLAPGMYSVHVWANQQGASTATWEANGAASVALSICTSAALSPTNPSAAAGTTVTLTASSTGCASPQYEFWVQYPNGTWYLVQGWGSATFNWNTAGLAPGTYNVHAWARNTGDPTATFEAYAADVVTLTGCTSASVSGMPLSPQAVGTSITLTASSSGCPTPVYKFWVQYPDGTWHLLRDFSPTAAFVWNTMGLAKGTYTVRVWANNQGAATNTWESYGSAIYTLT
jgi:hypothetical protein